jgi:hypothetical protein
MTTRRDPKGKRQGNLSIPLPFDEAVKAALDAKPPPKKPRKPRTRKKPAKM